MVIYKEMLGIDGETVVVSGNIKRVLDVQWQKGVGPVVWFESDERAPFVKIPICGIGTGWELGELADDFKYLGTLQDNLGFVWHYYAKEYEEWIPEAHYEDEKGAFNH